MATTARAEEPFSAARARARGLADAARIDVRAFAEAFFSRDGSAPPRERMDWFVEDIDDFVAHLGPRARGLFHLILAVPTYAAPLLVGHVGRLSDLEVQERIAALDALERSKLGMALYAAKAMVSLVYYEHPDAAAEIGWDARCKGGGR